MANRDCKGRFLKGSHFGRKALPLSQRKHYYKILCAYCGKEKEGIQNSKELILGRIPRYCSAKCKSEDRRGKPLPYLRRPIQGIVIRAGYLLFQYKGKQRNLHRSIMEDIIGRKLKKDEIVHHINENKVDNRPENLQIMFRSEHTAHHWGA